MNWRKYIYLKDLNKKKEDEISQKSDFMNLPLNERRMIMEEQAQKMILHYQQNIEERQNWQSGEFSDEY